MSWLDLTYFCVRSVFWIAVFLKYNRKHTCVVNYSRQMNHFIIIGPLKATALTKPRNALSFFNAMQIFQSATGEIFWKTNIVNKREDGCLDIMWLSTLKWCWLVQCHASLASDSNNFTLQWGEKQSHQLAWRFIFLIFKTNFQCRNLLWYLIIKF